MFVDLLCRRNPRFIEAAVALHQAGRVPAGSYLLDLDAMAANAVIFKAEAERLALTVFVMTKQFGRNPAAIDALATAGLDRFVAVDMGDARRIHETGHTLGHVGHLVQVPFAEAATAAAMEPEFWSVFNDEKAQQAAGASASRGREQRLLARIQSSADTYYPGHEGGFDAAEVTAVADRLGALDGAAFAGVTSFPALLFDGEKREVRPTPNLATLNRAADELRAHGHERVEVNAPGTTSTSVLGMLADAGATQVEPGHGLTGMTPLHAVRDLDELPAALYLSEVSHLHAGRSYCFGGGFYIDPVFPPYAVTALVGREPRLDALRRVPAEIPPPGAIDYYGQLETSDARVGDAVIFGFRMQAFFRRALVVAIRGAGSGSPQVAGISTSDGTPVEWPA